MRVERAILLLVAVAVLLTAAVGCSGGERGLKEKVDEAVGLIASSQPLLEDLLDLDRRFNALGTRFHHVEDTIKEGKSLVDMAMIDVDELEARYARAREILREVAESDEGRYAEYARLALEAVETEMEAFSMNRQLLLTVSDMLAVLPLAESAEQLS